MRKLFLLCLIVPLTKAQLPSNEAIDLAEFGVQVTSDFMQGLGAFTLDNNQVEYLQLVDQTLTPNLDDCDRPQEAQLTPEHHFISRCERAQELGLESFPDFIMRASTNIQNEGVYQRELAFTGRLQGFRREFENNPDITREQLIEFGNNLYLENNDDFNSLSDLPQASVERTNYEVDAFMLVNTYRKNDPFRSSEDGLQAREAILDRLRSSYSDDDIITLLGTLGSQSTRHYDYNRKEDRLADRFSATRDEVLETWATFDVSFDAEDCSGIHDTLGYIARQINPNLQTFLVSGTTPGAKHTTLAYYNPENGYAAQVNYGSTRQVYSSGHDFTTPMVESETYQIISDNLRVWGHEREPLAEIPTEMGMLIRQVSGIESDTTNPLVDDDFSIMALGFGANNQSRLFSSYLPSTGNHVIGINHNLTNRNCREIWNERAAFLTTGQFSMLLTHSTPMRQSLQGDDLAHVTQIHFLWQLTLDWAWQATQNLNINLRSQTNVDAMLTVSRDPEEGQPQISAEGSVRQTFSLEGVQQLSDQTRIQAAVDSQWFMAPSDFRDVSAFWLPQHNHTHIDASITQQLGRVVELDLGAALLITQLGQYAILDSGMNINLSRSQLGITSSYTTPIANETPFFGTGPSASAGARYARRGRNIDYAFDATVEREQNHGEIPATTIGTLDFELNW